MSMGCSPSKEEFVLKIGDRDFPRHLLGSLCSESESNISKLVLSMRAAGFIGSLLQQLPQQPQTASAGRQSSAESTQTIFMSDGNYYDLNADTVRTAAHLRTVLANVHDLMVYHSSGRTLHDFLDLSPFVNTSNLSLVDVPIHLVHYLKTLRPNLKLLSVHRCADSPKKVFETCGGDQAFPALWTRLEVADLRWNSLRELDDSFKLLPCLHTLDLSNNRLTDVSGLEYLTNLRVLNLSYNCLSRIPVLEATQHALRVLLMRFNRLGSLRNVEFYTFLSDLDVSNNVVCDINHLHHLKGLRCLTQLSVANNPFGSIQKATRTDVLRYVNHLVPINFHLNGRTLSDKENFIFRKARVSRITPSSTPLSASLVMPQSNPGTIEESSAGATRFEASVDSRRGLMPDTGGSEADISSSDAEGYLTSSLTARARLTRHHLDTVRGRYGANWLVNWNRSEMGRAIPSPPLALLGPVPSSQRPSPLTLNESEIEQEKKEENEATIVEERQEEDGLENDAEDVIKTVLASSLPSEGDRENLQENEKRKEEEEEEEEEDDLEPKGDGSDSQVYVTAVSDFGSDVFPSSFASSAQLGSSRSEPQAPEVYTMRWETEEEPQDLTGEGLHFVVTPLLPSGTADQRMLVVGTTHCLVCCLRTGQVEDRHELRLLTSVRREEDGFCLSLAFRCADPGQRARRFRFAESQECERCRAELAGHLLEPNEMNLAVGMHCFRCRNQVETSKVARVMELDPSTGERVLVPACPHCGYRALAEEVPSEEEKRNSVPKSVSPPASSFSSSLIPMTTGSPDQRTSVFPTRLSASSSTTSSNLARVPCDWILFDRNDFSEFDHQIKRHFTLHVLTSESEECRLHLKCHGTPYNRADFYECIVLFTTKKFYFFRWKFHESQAVAKCLTLQDKIDLSNLTRIQSGPCFQWFLLEFQNAKRSLLFPGDPTSSERFLHQLAELLDPSVINFACERQQREAFCSDQLAQVDIDSGEQLLTTIGLSPSISDADSVGLWVCRCPGAKYAASNAPLTATLNMWSGREVKRNWTLLVLSAGRFLTFDLEYQVGWSAPKPHSSKCWSVTDISSVKRGRDGLSLMFLFFRHKTLSSQTEAPKSLTIMMEEELSLTHFFAAFQTQWEQFYGIPLHLQ